MHSDVTPGKIGWCINDFSRRSNSHACSQIYQRIKPFFQNKAEKKKRKFCSWNKEKCIACELFSYWTQGVQITFFSIQHELRAQLIYYVQILNHTILVNHLGCLIFFFCFSGSVYHILQSSILNNHTLIIYKKNKPNKRSPKIKKSQCLLTLWEFLWNVWQKEETK